MIRFGSCKAQRINRTLKFIGLKNGVLANKNMVFAFFLIHIAAAIGKFANFWSRDQLLQKAYSLETSCPGEIRVTFWKHSNWGLAKIWTVRWEVAKFIFLADSYETLIRCYLFEMPNLCLSIAIVDFYWETTTQLQCS